MLKNENRDTRKFHLNRMFSYDKIKSYHKKYIDKVTGCFKKNYVEMRVCPICGCDKHIYLFSKSGGHYVRCTRCDMIFLNPVFKEQALKDYYKDLDTEQSTITENESDFYREIYLLGLEKIKQKIDHGRILDVGCGGGFFLDIAKENKWKTFGIEPCRNDRLIAEKKGHIFNLEDERFDVITLWDVFEHIVDPNSYLKMLNSWLKDDGMVFIQTPNVDSFAARILQNRCNMFDGLEHVNVYSPVTIKRTLDGNGFNILNIDTVISELGVVNNYLSYRDPYFGKQRYNDNVLGFINEKLIHKYMLGYKMQLLCKKKAGDSF